MTKAQKSRRSFDWLAPVYELTLLPRHFGCGLFIGLLAPVLALAALVGGIYLATRRILFVRPADQAGGPLTPRLMDPSEVRAVVKERGEELMTLVRSLGQETATPHAPR